MGRGKSTECAAAWLSFCMVQAFLLVCVLMISATDALADEVNSLAEKPAPLADVLRGAQQVLSEGDTAAALTLLSAAEAEYAGVPEFDYLMGLAAVRSGQPSVGIFVLDRLLQVQPDHAGGAA
ncbi:hypothetical protein [Oceanospirillum linum]|nr:hypothetical protein [Oceanospirillum linum]